MTQEQILEAAQAVLDKNFKGNHTIPAQGLYPHQWLWDSCFIAIGQRHFDVERAQTELLGILRGQWSNGMIPNMVLNQGRVRRHNATFWRSSVSPYSPDNVQTSGITQPPMLAEAIVKVGQKLDPRERRTWYQRVYPALVSYHQWLYTDRDPHQEGLVLQLHPWETGLDNTPPWMYELHQHQMPLWIRTVEKLRLDLLMTPFRKDSLFALPGERLSTIDALSLYSIQRRLRRKRYDTQAILSHSHLAIEDVSYNAIFIRANEHLKSIAKTIGKTLPEDLRANIRKTKEEFEKLWDAYSGQYYSRNFVTHKLIKVPSIGTLLPLYAGTITKERAKMLVDLLNDKHQFAAKYPVPTVPLKSEWFHAHMYWQGPTWINTNWLIIEGLKRYGFDKEADHIREQSIKLYAGHGSSEYFSPIDGSPAGAKNFSWTAALIIDMLHDTK